MAKPQVTITLGRSGQRVVKKAWGGSDGRGSNASLSSGSKRSLAESFGSGVDNLFSNNKKMREDSSSRSNGHSSLINDSHLGPRDLRLKLTRKRISRRMELENEERKKMELREKLGSMRSSYASRTSNGTRQSSPERIPKSSPGIPTPRSANDQLPQSSLVGPRNALKTERGFVRNPLESSGPKVPLFTALRHPLDCDKLVPGPNPGIVGMSGSSYQVPKDNQPLTVSSLLQSLGLGKYSINFQAEEIDMVALKQMGENDLKELGVPMGPRKKILQALQARFKRPTIQALRIV